MRVYLDSNFFITLLLKRKNDTKNQDYTINSQIVEKIKNKEIIGVISWYTFAEIIGELKKEYNRNHNLGDSDEDPIPEKDRAIIIDTAESFLKIENMETYECLPKEDFTQVPATVGNICINTKDAQHFLIAKKLNVDWLITEDDYLRKRVKHIVPACYPQEFLESLQ